MKQITKKMLIHVHPGKRDAIFFIVVFLLSLLVYLFITHGFIATTEVLGKSMEPALQEGERYFMCRWICRVRPPQPGQIIAIELPWESDLSVKRVVALPGQSVQIKNGQVYVNGKVLHEPYLADDSVTKPGKLGTNLYRVARRTYFVLGDNRDSSVDSRHFGAIQRNWIRGLVLQSTGEIP